MKYAKLINGSISYAPNPILHDGLWCDNLPIFENKEQIKIKET